MLKLYAWLILARYFTIFCNGCISVDCLDPMGIENGAKVTDGQLLVSSSRDSLSGASAGRLFNEFGAWVPQ